MKAWQLATFTIMISVSFASIPTIFQWVGLEMIPVEAFSSDYSALAQSGGNDAYNTLENTENDLSLFTITASALKLGMNIVSALLTANHQLFQVAGVPDSVWLLYGTYHYITLIAFVTYVLTGREL